MFCYFYSWEVFRVLHWLVTSRFKNQFFWKSVISFFWYLHSRSIIYYNVWCIFKCILLVLHDITFTFRCSVIVLFCGIVLFWRVLYRSLFASIDLWSTYLISIRIYVELKVVFLLFLCLLVLVFLILAYFHYLYIYLLLI